MKLNKRGWIVLVIIPAIVATLFLTWATRDVCYVGEGGNFLGYGSMKLSGEINDNKRKTKVKKQSAKIRGCFLDAKVQN